MVFIAEVPYVQFAREHIVLLSTAKVRDPNLMETCRDLGNQDYHVGSAVITLLLEGRHLQRSDTSGMRK